MELETRRVFIKSGNLIAVCLAIRQENEIILVSLESSPIQATNDTNHWASAEFKIAHEYLCRSLTTKAPASDKMLWDILPEDILIDTEFIAAQNVSGGDYDLERVESQSRERA